VGRHIVTLDEYCGGSRAGLEVWPRDGEPTVIDITLATKSIRYARWAAEQGKRRETSNELAYDRRSEAGRR